MPGTELFEDKNHIEVVFGITEGVESSVLIVEMTPPPLFIATSSFIRI